VVDGAGNYLFHRKVQTPRLHHTWVAHLATFTCATFFRRSVIFDRGLFFDARLKIAGDGEWMVRLLQQRVSLAVLRRFTSVFTFTGENLGGGAAARREARALSDSAPLWARRLKGLLVLHHRVRRMLGGIYFQKPFAYSLYTSESPAQRVEHQVARPKFKWKS
jgi:hypothetical protein